MSLWSSPYVENMTYVTTPSTQDYITRFVEHAGTRT